MNCAQETQHCCWYVVVSTCFSVSLSNQGPASKRGLAGPACRRQLFAPSSPCLGVHGPFWVLRRERQLGPGLPFVWRDTEGNALFFWGVIGCLLRSGRLLQVFCSSAPLVAGARARFADVRAQLAWGSYPEPWLCRAGCAGMQPEGQWGEDSRPRSRWPSWRCPPAWVPRSSLAQALGHACYKEDLQRIICTWGCDNTSVDFFFFYKSSEMFAKWVLLFFF